MYTVKTFNHISDVIYSALTADRFWVSDEPSSYDAALVRSQSLHELALDDRLLAIARAGAGVNNIPVDRCSEQGIVVFNTPGANANAVKELVLCAMLLSGRRVFDAISWAKELDAGTCDIEQLVESEKKRFTGPELYKKKLGVIGLGAIGVMVANAAHHGLGMEVLGYDPYISVEAAWHLSRSILQAKTLEEIYRSCDYITLHLPLNDKTRGMIGETAISSMKPEAVILNFARGGLVNNQALLSALAEDRLRAYITDFPDAEILGSDKVVAIPHLGASTPESEENCAQMAASQLKDYLISGTIKNSVNFPDCELPLGDSYRIAIINKNITNMVGQITAHLATYGYNIEHMLNKSRGNWAYTLIDLDKKPRRDCIKAINDIDGVVRVRIMEP